MAKWTLSLTVAVVILVPKVSYSQSDVIYTTYKYIMGDNDTKNDAKRLCFIEAKRRCIEKAGTYIESQTDVTNFHLTRDEIKSYAVGIIKVDVASEETKFESESVAIYMTVKAQVDIEDLRRKVERIRGNKSLENKVRKQQKELALVEERVRKLQNELAAADFEKRVNIRRERQQAFNKMDELSRIKFTIQQKTQLAVENIEIGMTPEEVESLIGPPRAISSYGHMNYGKVWVVIESGVVTCIVHAKAFDPTHTRLYYEMILPKSLIK